MRSFSTLQKGPLACHAEEENKMTVDAVEAETTNALPTSALAMRRAEQQKPGQSKGKGKSGGLGQGSKGEGCGKRSRDTEDKAASVKSEITSRSGSPKSKASKKLSEKERLQEQCKKYRSELDLVAVLSGESTKSARYQASRVTGAGLGQTSECLQRVQRTVSLGSSWQSTRPFRTRSSARSGCESCWCTFLMESSRQLVGRRSALLPCMRHGRMGM